MHERRRWSPLRTVACCAGVVAILVALGLVLIARGSGAMANSPAPAETTRRSAVMFVEVAPVERRSVASDAEFTGSLLPQRVTRIVPEVEGIVSYLPKTGTFEAEIDGKRYAEPLSLRLGESVKQGDVLLKIDAADFEIALKIAEAKLAKAKADLASLRAWKRPEEVQRLIALQEEARARHELALNEHRRAVTLAQRSAVSQSELERHAMESGTTKALLDSATANVRQAQAGPTQEEVSIHTALIAAAEAEVSQRQRELEKTTITAPYDGVVTAIHIDEGDRVAPSSGTVMELLEVRYLLAEIGVPESYLGQINIRDQAEIRLAGSTDPIPGMVIAINEKVEPQTRTFKVRVAIDNARRQFKAGQFAKVRLIFAENENRLTVPSSALVFFEGQPHAFTFDGERVHRQPIRIGAATAELTEVVDGLKDGDVVVIHDPALLSDGALVEIKQQRMAAHRESGRK